MFSTKEIVFPNDPFRMPVGRQVQVAHMPSASERQGSKQAGITSYASLYSTSDYIEELERVERQMYWLTIASLIVAVLAIIAIVGVVIQAG